MVFFRDLSPMRQPGFGIAPLLGSEIGDYFDRLGWGDYRTFFRRIRACDQAFVEFHLERQSKATKNDG